MRTRLALIPMLLLGAVSAAHANSAMGLALEMFDYAYWWPYVVATVVLEAWMIGRRLGDGWLKALGISLIANAMTACCCPMVCVSGLHSSFVGTQINPNPFLNALFLFTSFGVVSALLESIVWKLRRTNPSDWTIVGRSLLAHAIGVPLALAILLIPARPYKGLEATAGGARHRYLYSAFKNFSNQTAGDPRGIPAVTSAADFISRFGTLPGDEPISSAWAAAYLPDFHRFDLGEAKRRPYQWNTKAAGLVVLPDAQTEVAVPSIWLLRAESNGTYNGYALDTMAGTISPFYGLKKARLDADATAAIRADAELKKLLPPSGGR